jgi:peptidyl-prolyl cis-trans isomerase A (cyclophilin A)
MQLRNPHGHGPRPQVKFVTSAGEFVVEVYPDKAPKTVENFLQYVRDKHYNGTIFHRVIGNFMIQGGGFDTRYMERASRAPVMHEGREALAKGGPRNTAGTLAMARTNDPHSATAQFFINVVDNGFLDPTMGLHRVWQSGLGHGDREQNQGNAHKFWRPLPF